MTAQQFSDRHGYRPATEAKPDDYLPGWVREGVTNQIREFVLNPPERFYDPLDLYLMLRPYIWQVLDREPPTTPMSGPWAFYIPRTLSQCEWWQFYDILEQVCGLIKTEWGPEFLAKIGDKIDPIFAQEGIPWILHDGKFVRRFNPQMLSIIEQAQTLLTASEYNGPDQQFAKAVEHLNKRPQPDLENCVKDSVGALEALANIIAGTSGVQLNRLLDRDPFRSNIHPTIGQAIEKLYAYRGAAPGVAHGQVGPATVGLADATWVFNMSAASLIYLADRFRTSESEA